MKKILLAITLLISIVIQISGAQAVANAADGALSLVNVGIYPQPVVSGSNINITFQLYNSYSGNLKNVNLQLVSQNQLINVSPAYTYLINVIGTGLYGGIGYNRFVYTFHIPSTLPSGEYTIDVLATYETTQTEGTSSIDVPAQSEMPISFYVYGPANIDLSASPVEITPGQNFNLNVVATNGGSGPAQNISIAVNSTGFFRVIGPSKFNIGNLPASGENQFAVMLLPSQNISGGTYKINMTVSYTNQFGAIITRNESILLNVAIEKPNVVAVVSSAYPQMLYAGGNQTLQFEIENTGEGLAKNVTVSFYNTSDLSLGSISSFFISQLPPGASVPEQLYVSANRNLNGSIYYLPIKISYESSNYKNATAILKYIPLQLQNIADFNITSEEGILNPGASYAPLTFHIKNIGNEDAQQVSFSLQTVYPITPITPNVYINNIAPGQEVNATFYVSIDTQAKSGAYPVAIYEQWRQSNGGLTQEFSASENYFASVSSNAGSEYNSLANSIIVIIVIAAMVFYGYKRAISKKKAKKEAK
ncbi:MAG: COG1361 S-layer family protein [Candidatus Micrarchaeia archaeon]